MAHTQGTLELGKKGINKLYFVEAQTIPQQYMDAVGRMENTTETFYRARQLAGLAPAEQTPEGAPAAFDSAYSLYSRDFPILLYTKGTQFSKQTRFTDQYNQVASLIPAIARSFESRKNILAADLHNNGFTAISDGMNGETLYSTSHAMGTGGYTFANRPSTEYAFGPLNLESAMILMARQVSPRNTPMNAPGKKVLMVPIDLGPAATRVITSSGFAGTNDNDPNYTNSSRIRLAINDYLSSTTAWFMRSEDNNYHGLFMIQQMPFDMEVLPPDRSLMYSWIGSWSGCVGWYDAHQTFGSKGTA